MAATLFFFKNRDEEGACHYGKQEWSSGICYYLNTARMFGSATSHMVIYGSLPKRHFLKNVFSSELSDITSRIQMFLLLYINSMQFDY